MKRKLIATAMLVCAAGGLTSCGDDDASAPAGERKEVDLKEVVTTAAKGETAAAPAESEVRTQLIPLLADFPAINLEKLQVDSTPAEDGSLMVAARVQVSAGENLYAREEAPEMLNEERRAANDAMNRAMMPESYYLLLVGAQTEEITDADREVRALPPELQQQAAEMKELAERPVFHLRMPAHTPVELAATMTARRSDGRWEFSEVRFDTMPLHSLVSLIPEGALPQGSAVVDEGFEMRQRLALRRMVEAFNQAAAPYIQGREDAARQRMLEARSRAEESAKVEAERIAQKAAAHEQWSKLRSGVLKDGSLFTGEWKRGNAFGKISLRVVKVQGFEDSVQFTGVLSDPSLPQVELQVVGRMEQPAREGELVPMVVRIYSGRYDPDVPTAEVFDAQDGMLKLHMAQDGSAQGVLTCGIWHETPEKEFQVQLKHSVRKTTQPAKGTPAKPQSAARPQPARPQAAKPKS